MPSCVQNLIDTSSCPPAETGTVRKQHIGAFWHRYLNALEIVLHESDRRTAVVLQNAPELIGPRLALAAVSRDQRMLTEHIHFIVMRVG